jgi:hypothetical protein
MKKILNMLIAAIFIAATAPINAQAPSEVVDLNRDMVEKFYDRTIINPMDPGYIWGNPFAIVLSGVNSDIFQNAAFKKDPGGMASGNLYTSSINDFMNGDMNAGDSNATRKVAKIGLVNWP